MEENGASSTVNEDQRPGVETTPPSSPPQSPPGEANAGDASIQAPWPRYIKSQPSLSSLLQDLTVRHAFNVFQVPDEEKHTSSSYAEMPPERPKEPEKPKPRPERPKEPEKPKEELEKSKPRPPPEKPKEEDSDAEQTSSDVELSNSVISTASGEISSDEEQDSVYIDMNKLSSIPFRERVRLRNAAVKGDWKEAEHILKDHPDAVQAPLTAQGLTVLHIAAFSKHNAFAEEVMKLMSPKDLGSGHDAEATAFAHAVLSGNVHCAKMMMKKTNTNTLPLIRDSNGKLPIYWAVSSGERKMVSYLIPLTPFEELTSEDRNELFLMAIVADMYDVAFCMVTKDRRLATAKDEYGSTALKYLAEKTPSIGSTRKLLYWKRYLNSWFEGTSKEALVRQLVEEFWEHHRSEESYDNLLEELLPSVHDAARAGNVEFLSIILHSFPDLILATDDNKQNIFHIAISHRQHDVFNLAYELSTKYDIAYHFDKNGNSLLHLAGQAATQGTLKKISGVALQLQQEWLWFKEIEKITPPMLRTFKNSKGQTAYRAFMVSHNPLWGSGEKWIKDTENNSVIVATLIATIAFTAAFTIPGGTHQENGTPIHLENNWFLVFFASNAIALLSSSSSILNFLSFLILRYDGDDFFKSLPRRLLLGFVTLFISIMGMIVAFSAACFLMYQGKTTWIPILIIGLGGVLVILFLWQHLGFWSDIIRTTYGFKFLFRPSRHGPFRRRKMPSPRIDWP